MPIEVTLYRFDHGDGTSKDWACPAHVPSDAAFAVYYGRTGTALRQAVTPAAQCQDDDPHREAEVRTREKLAKGYVRLGRYRLSDDRRGLTPVQDPPEPGALRRGSGGNPPVGTCSGPCLYWRCDRERCGDRDSRRVLEHAAARLQAVGWLTDDRLLRSPNALWLAIAGSEWQGCLPLDAGHRVAIACWVLLARADIGIGLANEAGERVTTWPEDVPITAETLEALGLRPRDWNRLLGADGDDDWFF